MTTVPVAHQNTKYRMPSTLQPAGRSLSVSSMKAPSLLPDIKEQIEPERRSPARSPSPGRPNVRSVSVASFLSDGTVEIEGFGLDTSSENGDDDGASIYDGASLYADSIYDGRDGSDPEERNSDISWRAERILASAKKRLDLCGQNISRARSSLILSPSTTPTRFMEQLSLDAAANGQGAVIRNASPALPQQQRGTSPALSQRVSSPALQHRSSSAQRGERFPVNPSTVHSRAASTSALHPGSGSPARAVEPMSTISDQPEHPSEIKRPASELSRGKSAEQMRLLRDQMKDLRGKISSLQQQNKADTSRRSESRTSLRSNGSSSYGVYKNPSLDDIRSRRKNSTTPEEWEHVRKSTSISPSTSRSGTPRASRCGTPRAFRQSERSELVTSSFSERHEDREDAFSYDSYLIGGTIYPIGNHSNRSGIFRPTSIVSDASTASTIQPAPHPPPLKRRDSFISISSYATAAEDPSSKSPSTDSRASPAGWLPTPPVIPAGDDGYHSAPHTPRADKPLPPPPSRKADSESLGNSTWYRASMDTVTEYGRDSVHYGEDSTPGTSYMRKDSTASTLDIPMMPIQGPGVPVAIGPSAHDSQTMVVATREGSADIELKLDREDRALIECMIEALGRVCCRLESEGRETEKEDLRSRLRDAARLLEGERIEQDIGLEMF